MANDGRSCTGQVGDLCETPGDCCSRSCATTSDGVKRCVPAGGCSLECEVCSSDGECCSGKCMAGPGPDMVQRCQPAGMCGAEGESCMGADDCCSGQECMPAARGAPSRCTAGPDASCGAPGAGCALASDCCGGRCILGEGALACAAGCAEDGAPCTAASDCCGTNSDCVRLGASLICAPTH